MGRQKILFVLPDIKTGGTVSSFVGVFNVLKACDVDMKILLLDKHGYETTPFANHIIKSSFLITAYKSNFSEMNFFEKIFSLPIKLLKQFRGNRLFSVRDYIFSKTCSELSKYQFNYVVAFQEDTPSFLTSFFKDIIKIAWIHGDYTTRYKALLPETEHDLYCLFDKIVNVSKYTTDAFVSVFPDLKERCLSIHNLIDEHYVKSKALEYKPNEINSDIFTIVSVGRLTSIKRFDRIPEIAQYLHSHKLMFRWLILGPDAEPEARNKIESNIQKYGVSDYVQIIGNKLNPYPYFFNSSLLVCLSSTEACPMIFNEAKICGIPVVSSNFGSAHEFIVEGVNGYITSIDDMAHTIESLMVDVNKYKALKTTSRNYDDFNEKIISQLHELFQIHP